MGLDKPPPSRYTIEEKDGRLIVHDSMASGQVLAPIPLAQPRSALDGSSLTAPVSPSLSRTAGGVGRADTGADSGKAKRGASVAAIGMGLVFFLFITNLWPIMAIAMLIPPVRKQLRGSVLPAVKRYIDEGRVS